MKTSVEKWIGPCIMGLGLMMLALFINKEAWLIGSCIMALGLMTLIYFSDRFTGSVLGTPANKFVDTVLGISLMYFCVGCVFISASLPSWANDSKSIVNASESNAATTCKTQDGDTVQP